MTVTKFICTVFFLLRAAVSIAQNYTPVDQQSSVTFEIANLGFDVDGVVKGLQGQILFDEKNLSSSAFQVTVQSSTINTENAARDKHLRGEDYFFVNKYPLMKLVSVKVAKSSTPGYFVLFASLTIKDKTQQVVIPFTVTPEAGAFRFKGEFKIKRRDFGIGGKNTISNELKVKLNVLAKKI